jgi:GTPase SAR1 family protein
MIYGSDISRPEISPSVRKALSQSPEVALLGPGQVGKTTLARAFADEIKGTLYLDLERSTDLRMLEYPRALLHGQVGKLTRAGKSWMTRCEVQRAFGEPTIDCAGVPQAATSAFVAFCSSVR